ncbi:hypothetical protein, partial [Candidatus Avelusimicrobium fimicolum]|uniref:hypothetical protein n=1 Tax=Candidatus Avelusimicrobium fimicolum TaxID=3416216 RepID=UPI003D1372BD
KKQYNKKEKEKNLPKGTTRQRQRQHQTTTAQGFAPVVSLRSTRGQRETTAVAARNALNAVRT